MKKVLLIIPSNVDTIALTSLNLYEAIKQRSDVVVKCVVVHKYPNGFPQFEGCEWHVDTTSKNVSKILAAVKQVRWLKKIKRQFKPDISISTLFSCSTISVLSQGNDFKIGVFHASHTQFRDRHWLGYQALLLIYWFVYPFLDKLHCVSRVC